MPAEARGRRSIHPPAFTRFSTPRLRSSRRFRRQPRSPHDRPRSALAALSLGSLGAREGDAHRALRRGARREGKLSGFGWLSAARAGLTEGVLCEIALALEPPTGVSLFGGGRRADLTRHAAFGSAQIPLSRSGAISGQIGAGGVGGGELVHGAARDTLGPGFAGFVGVAGRVVQERGALPFVQVTLTVSTTHALTRTAGRDSEVHLRARGEVARSPRSLARRGRLERGAVVQR